MLPDGVHLGKIGFIDSAASVYLDAFTLKNRKANHPDDISGSYTPIT